MHRTIVSSTMMQSPLQLLASSPSSFCVAAAVTTRQTAPLSWQYWCAAMIPTVVPRPLSLLAGLCRSGTNCFCSLVFLPFLSSCCFLCHCKSCWTALQCDIADGVSAVATGWLLLHHRRCHRLLHCDASSHSLHCCFLPLLVVATASCQCLLLSFACCGMPVIVDTQCRLMSTVPHHSRRWCASIYFYSLAMVWSYTWLRVVPTTSWTYAWYRYQVHQKV